MAGFHRRSFAAAAVGSVFCTWGWNAGSSRRGRSISKIVFVELDKWKIKTKKVKLRETSTFGNHLLKNEFGERRLPRSGGWRVSQRRSRVLRFREVK